MSIAPLHHVVVSVTDLQRSIAFYRDVLGFRQTLESPVDGNDEYLHLPAGTGGTMTMLAADERTLGMIELIQWEVPGGVPATPAKRPGDPGVCMLALEVNDETLEQVCERLAEHGVALYSPITPVELEGYPRFHTLLIEDPDGLLIELIQLPTREEVRAFRAAMRARSEAAAGVGDRG